MNSSMNISLKFEKNNLKPVLSDFSVAHQNDVELTREKFQILAFVESLESLCAARVDPSLTIFGLGVP